MMAAFPKDNTGAVGGDCPLLPNWGLAFGSAQLRKIEQ
jgi:hypothetical protein